MKIRRMISGTLPFALVAIIALALLYATPFSYWYCLERQESWLASKTETELDRRMFAFYTKRSISPSESSRGRDYVLRPNERMVQYLVFGKEPFDVVFDSGSSVVAAFTSYE